MNTQKFVCSWSGGKDSCYAVMKAVAAGYQPAVLLNVLNEEGKISRSHGIPKNILQAQALAAGLPIVLLESSWSDYEQKFRNALIQLREDYSVGSAVFGDIDLQPHRDWEEKICDSAGLKAMLPLWQQNRRSLAGDMLAAGIQTIIVSCNEVMGEKYLGRILDTTLIDELEHLGIDACGENGEYHTLVIDCPLFANKIPVVVEGTVKHEHYWFTKLALAK